jgi:hypothetical protein
LPEPVRLPASARLLALARLPALARFLALTCLLAPAHPGRAAADAALAQGLCPPPWPAVFKQATDPVLAPERDYEQDCVVEPNVLLGPDGLYHMAYSCNAFSAGGRKEAIGLATSADLLHWTRYGKAPIVGDGQAGVAGAAGMASQLRVGKEYRLYFRNHDSGSVDYLTSRDAYHYRYAGTAIPLRAPGLSIPADPGLPDYCSRPLALDSCGFIQAGGLWWALVEVAALGRVTDSADHCPGRPGYTLWLFRSKDGARSFQPAAGPLDTLTASIGLPKTDIYAGGRANFTVRGAHYTFPHLGLPSLLALSKSGDLIHWRTYARPVFGFNSRLLGLKACNQAADASVIQAQGKTYLFYDGTDNDHKAGRIGVAVFPGTEADLDACRDPSAR